MRFFQLQSQRMWCYYFLPVPYNWFSLSKNHQRVTVMNHCFYCFDGFWKVKAKYIVLRLNALAKLKNVTGASRHSVLMGNCPTFSHMPSPHQSTKWFLIISIHVVWGAWDSVATRDIPLEKKVDMKCMQVNVLKNNQGWQGNCMFLSCHIRILDWISTLQLPKCQERFLARNRRDI